MWSKHPQKNVDNLILKGGDIVTIALLLSDMIVDEPGIYTTLDGSYKVFLNKGDIIPTREGKIQTLKLNK